MDVQPVPRIEIQPDPEALASEVAGALIGRLAESQESGHEPQIGLTGGTIADRIHREVAQHMTRPERDVRHVDWSRVTVWFGDERFVTTNSPDRNVRQARDAFLDAVGATRVREVPASDAVADAESAAAAYEAAIKRDGAGEFDILMLGLGPDGHVASLFPGHAALEVSDQIAVAVHDSPKPPPDRVSLTFSALNRARSLWFLVSGEDKAEAVARALADTGTVAETPARGVVGREETIWFLDAAAASQL